MSVALHQGDMLDMIPRLVAAGMVCDAVVTDLAAGSAARAS